MIAAAWLVVEVLIIQTTLTSYVVGLNLVERVELLIILVEPWSRKLRATVVG